jgi:hypothetical protein
MIQFLKPRSSRRRSQRHLDVAEPAPMPLPDVTDWLAKNAEPAGLTAEEAAEIQFAFQQQVDHLTHPDPLMLAAESVDRSLMLDAPALIPELEPLLLLPASIESPSFNCADAVMPELAIVPTPALVDAAALVEFRLETCSSGLAIVPPIVELAEAELVEVERLEVECVAPALPETIIAKPLADADQKMAIDSLVEDDLVEPVVEVPIDWVNANWASEAVDVAAVEASASEAEVAATDPSSYFQYYLDENAIGGQGAADELPAAYVTPWRQPSMPRGLIGAGVLGATLVSGFVIADTVKTSPVTAVKPPVSPLQSLSAKDQAMTATALPKVMPPESMKPEVALPKPKSMTMIRPVFPPLAPLGQSMTMSPVGSAIARSDASNPLPQSNANTPTALTLNAPPAPVVRIASPVTPTESDRPASPILPAPRVLQSTSPALPPPSFTPAPFPQDLPELTPDVTVPVPTSGSTPQSEAAALTPTPLSSPLQRVPQVVPDRVPPVSAPPALVLPAQNVVAVPPVDVVVPTQPVVAPAAIAPAAAVAPSIDQSAAILPADRVFTREVAPSVLPDQTAAATPMPPVEAAQPIADRSTRLPQVQNLLARPAVNAYVPMVAGWRPLLQEEAAAALKTSPQLDGYTRQQLSQQAYVQAYLAISQTADAIPSFGFIDFQRKLIILPPGPETASNSTEHSRSTDGEVMLAQRTMSL